MANEGNNELTLPPASVDLSLVTPTALAHLPKAIAREFGAVFFRETDTELSLGVVHPELLKTGAVEAVTVLEQQVGKKIKLYRITEADYRRVFALYNQDFSSRPTPTPPPPAAERPPHYRVGETVNDGLLTKIPITYAKQYRLIAVDQAESGVIWLALERETPEITIMLELMGRRNRLSFKKLVVPATEIDRLLNVAQALAPKEVLAPKEAPPLTEEKQLVEAAAKTSESEDFTGPSGSIVTGQVEKAGLAGLLQRAAGVLSSRDSTESTPVDRSASSPLTALAEQDASRPTPATDQPTKGPLAMPKKSTPSATGPATEIPVIKEIPGISNEEPSPSEDNEQIDPIFKRPVTDSKQLLSILQSGSMPRMVAGVINFAVSSRASDVHIEPYGDELIIRYRVDGQLSEVVKLPMSIHPSMISRIKILARLKLDESRIPQDGRFDVVAPGKKEIDIRVSTLPTVHGEKIVMRLLDKSEGIYTLEKLGLSGDGFTVLVEAIKRAYGVVLSTGPTGSGKTTTLYAILRRVATTNVNVVTLEDPVEYEMSGINQSQIKPKIGFTFADGLRSVLRQDPNIIMVGEIRDAETASMVTHAALTGHLVLSTLHTNDASGALPRLINMGIEPFLITSSINAIVGQRLVRRLCQKCKQRVELPATVRKEIDEELAAIRQVNSKEASRIPGQIEFFRPGSCAECVGGYKGRVGLFEVLSMNDAIEELAVKKAPAMDIRQAAQASGMITMKQDGILKVLAGATSLDEVLRETSSR